jgi:hypothetical protein
LVGWVHRPRFSSPDGGERKTGIVFYPKIPFHKTAAKKITPTITSTPLTITTTRSFASFPVTATPSIHNMKVKTFWVASEGT